MNHCNNRGSISTASSGVAWKSGEVVSDQFPAGLRVLVVDDDPTCLMILGKMLRTCRYEVKTCNRAEIALSLLRENPNGYDIVISDVHMPDMDGFKLLEDIGLEMDLPVIMMSADDEKHVVMKGVTHGACDYLIKPVRIEALKTIWQHVVRKKKTEWKDLEQSGSAEECDRQTKQSEEADYSSAGNSEGNWRSTKKRKNEEEEAEDREDSSTLKKPRVVWSVELHQQFVAAVNQLGIDKAVPKKILELMSVPGLTRENVASHLQKYRLYLRRLSGVSQHQNNLGNSFLSSQEASYGPLASLNGLDLQTLAAAGQLPAQSLATLQAGGLGRQAVKSRIPMPIIEQRNIFSFDNSKLRFGEAQQQHLSNKQMNLLHGIPTNMEPKQLANLQHSAQSIGNINIPVNVHGSGGQSGQGNSLLMQMTQQQSRGQILNESPGSHPPRLPTSMGQPMMSNAVSGGMLATNGLAENGRGAGHSPVSQPSPILNYPLGNTAELTSNSFPLGSSPGITSLQSKGSFQDEINSDIKAPAGFIPSYDIFNELQQHKSHDWELQNVALPFTASQRANSLQSNSLDTGLSILTHQGFSSSQRNGQNSEMPTLGKAMFTSGNLSEHANVQNVARMNSFFGENLVRVKTEADQETNCQTGLFLEQFGQEDLMSALLKQQQGGMAQSENEFDFDGYNMDNIPV